MRPKLNRGKLIPPDSLKDAYPRSLQLGREVVRIKQQLRDPRSYLSPAEYDAWTTKAGAILKLFESEDRQLKEWIAKQELNLFQESYKLLKTLESEDALEDEEKPLIQKLDEFFAIKNAS